MKSTLSLSHDYADAMALSVFKFPENYKRDVRTATDVFCQTLSSIDFVSTLQVAYIRLRMNTVLLNIPATCLEINQALATLDQAYRSRYLELCNGDRSRFTGSHANWFSFLSKADRSLLNFK